MADREPQTPRPPLVSIALATYNGERFLQPLLESLLGQDYPQLEIVICDDASTDGTWSLLEGYRNAPGVTLVRNPCNLGYLKNFEKLLAMCRGDYIALADQDDWWCADKISRLVNAAMARDAFLVFSDAVVIDDADRLLHSSLERASGICYTSDDYRSFYLFNCVTGCTALVKRSLLPYALPFPDGIIVHDWWLAFVAARLGRMVFLRDKLVHYRIHDQNQIGFIRRPLISSLKGFAWSLICPWKILERKRLLQSWQGKYTRYFTACRNFECRHDLDSQTTATLLSWAADLNGLVASKRFARFFRQTPQLFRIIPPALRPLALLSRLVSVPDYDLLFGLVTAVYLGLALWGVQTLVH